MHGNKKTNKVLEDHGDWLIVEISSAASPVATMAVDTDIWNNYDGGRVRAELSNGRKYIYAISSPVGCKRSFHHNVICPCEGMEVDHIIHGTTKFIDNRRSNLRLVTKSQNKMNRSMASNNTSGVVGVSWNEASRWWRAYIMVNKKQIHLGNFYDIYIAIGARQQAEKEYFGEYAYRRS